MAQFRSIAQALELGYKITKVSYHQSFSEWCITCELKEYGHIKKTTFWRKTFPKYLKWQHFENERTKRCGLHEMTLVLDLENQ